MERKATKLINQFFTRLSFNDSVQALVNCVASVISCLQVVAMERGTPGQALLHGLVQQMSCYSFVVTSHFLIDAVGILGLLSRSLQRADLSYDQAKAIIDGSIQLLVHIPGSYTQTALKELPQAPDASGFTFYRAHDIKDIDKQHEKYRSPAESFIEEVVTRLQVAFPDTNIMSFFSIFSPCHSRAVSDEDDLKKLIQHFSPFVNEDEALTEWLLLRNIMEQDAHKNRNMKSFYKEYIHQTYQTFPNLSQLAATGLIIPVTSVDCEQGISTYNSIKTDARSSLSVAKTEMLLNLSMESKPLDHFNFNSTFRYWVPHKDRRGYHSLLNKCASAPHVSTSTTSSVENDLAEELPLDLSTY
ncbi:uncharacterized protein LOC143230801 [Tachypleus tridentatus]|uniref:uncharacterized protein LOC143230801 n=1 Tax=Tachypleus tridentatus TaxID=6853 RepID=UPI003FD012D5